MSVNLELFSFLSNRFNMILTWMTALNSHWFIRSFLCHLGFKVCWYQAIALTLSEEF